MNAPRPTPAVAAPVEEPLGRVLGLGRNDHFALVAALVLALLGHATAGRGVFRTFPYLRELATTVRKGMHDRLHSQVDIDEDKPPPPPPPPPPPTPEKEPEPPPPAARAAPPTPQAEAKPPAAAEAGKVLTSEPDPDEPVDLTGDGFVTGTGDRFAGGVTATKGSAKTAVRNAQAAATGTGTGTGPVAPPPAPTVNLTRTAGPLPGDWNDCGFPPEAEAEGINFARVLVSVTVRPDGRARAVSVLKDPGYGLGSWARQCAMRKTYQVALNAQGQAVEQTTPPFNIKFTR